MVKLQEPARRIVRRLGLELRRRKKGDIAAVGKRLGLSRAWFHYREESGDIRLKELMISLAHLRVAPLRFLRRALYGEGDMEMDFQRPRTPPPEVVLRAEERVLTDPGGRFSEVFIDYLDTIRYEQPQDALEQAESGVDHVDSALLPRFLGVLASIFRHLSRLDDAEHALFVGIEAAELERQPRVRAELIQRLAYVVADRDELETALLLSGRALSAFLYCGDNVGVARTMVDQGVWLSRQGRSQEAVNVAQIALRQLPETETVNRCTALHLVAYESRRLGKLDQAEEYVEKARKAEPTNAILAQDKLQWLTAQILADRGQLEKAEALMQEVFDRLCGYRNGEDALVICGLVKVQLRQGKSVEAHQTTRTLLKLIEPLRHDKVVSEAIADLLREGEDGLTLALVERLQARIEGELRATINAQGSSY